MSKKLYYFKSKINEIGLCSSVKNEHNEFIVIYLKYLNWVATDGSAQVEVGARFCTWLAL
jgi:hypothetical protein